MSAVSQNLYSPLTKSYCLQFINTLLGEDHMLVGHEMTSCTSKLEYFVIDPIPNQPRLKGRRVVIVDTPGFDDTYQDDVEILRRVAVWLASS
jgi:hypothetical protein